MASSQDINNNRISGNYENRPFEEFIEEIENKYPVRIFYKDEQTSSILVNTRFSNTTIEEVLSHILRGTGLSLLKYSDYHLIIIKESDPKRADISQEEESGSKELYVFNGYVNDANTGNPIPGATLFIEELKKGASTNQSGFFTFTISPGEYTISINSVGYLPEKRSVKITSKQTITFELFEKSIQLSEVTITESRPDQNVSGNEMGKNTFNIKTLKSIPPFLGEVDVFRSIILLPGVSTVGEGASGFNVRGGSVDQNLILLDEAPIFNPSHLFGFFSAFSSETIKDATLFRGGIPAQFGGRISSILDVNLKEGNMKTFHGQGGVGLVSSRLALEGPIIKDKTSFILSGRASYSDWILKSIKNEDLRNSSAAFYDINGKLTHRINEKNSISLTGYLSDDSFKFASDTTYGWGNKSATLQWFHNFNKKFFGNFTAILSQYQYEVLGRKPGNGFNLSSGINYKAFKGDFVYLADSKNKIDFGFSTSSYLFKPASLSPDTEESQILPINLENEQSLESGLYISNEYSVTKNFSIIYGLRYSLFHNLGPGNAIEYHEGLPKAFDTVKDTAIFASNKIIKNFQGFEPRFSFRWSLTPSSSLKGGYNRMNQYIHLISNTTAVTPLDIWQTSNLNIQPMTGDQFSLGYFRNFNENTIETSAEIYYKKIYNLIDYKEGAELLLNEHIETELVTGEGRAYGIELLVKKTLGRLTGWASYTFSRSERIVNNDFPEEKINNGNYYPSNFDKPHDLTLVGNIEFSKRISLSANFTYSTGRPITYPTSKYYVDDVLVVKYSERNQYRIPDYHRLDLSLTIEGNHKKNKKWHGNYNFSLYNVYSRRNAYSVFFRSDDTRNPQAFKLSVLGSMFPSIGYNFKF